MPTLVRLFPHEIVDAVRELTELHALSEQLDTAMAAHLLDSIVLDAVAYTRMPGRRAARRRNANCRSH